MVRPVNRESSQPTRASEPLGGESTWLQKVQAIADALQGGDTKKALQLLEDLSNDIKSQKLDGTPKGEVALEAIDDAIKRINGGAKPDDPNLALDIEGIANNVVDLP